MSHRPAQKTKRDRAGDRGARRCGLCGKAGKLTRTPCCGNWVCDDEGGYVLFSYAHNSCSRNHRRYTVCGQHGSEEHDGPWQSCDDCRGSIEPELYAHFATNDSNFEKLANPPPFEPTLCRECGTVIRLASDGYSMNGEGYSCEVCTSKKMNRGRPRS
jgi:hypothetical protein